MQYRHRDSTIGDKIAVELYEDLFEVAKSRSLVTRIVGRERVASGQNTRRGVIARRGDATLGELVPGAIASSRTGFAVAAGEIATVEIGVEVKILAKAMIKQIGRVITVASDQVTEFQRGGGNPICVGIVGVNWADRCTGYEGDRSFLTNGGKHPHPFQEAEAAESRLLADLMQRFDEFLILRFRARNESPYDFTWVDERATNLDYGAALTRVSREYEHRFGR